MTSDEHRRASRPPGPVVAGAHGRHIGIGLTILSPPGNRRAGLQRSTLPRARSLRPPTRAGSPGPEPPRPESERPSPASAKPSASAAGQQMGVKTPTGLANGSGPPSRSTTSSCSCPRGSTFGYLGPNSAGRTTLDPRLAGTAPAPMPARCRCFGAPVPARAGHGPGPGQGDLVDDPLPPAPDRPGQPPPAGRRTGPDRGIGPPHRRSARVCFSVHFVCDLVLLVASGVLRHIHQHPRSCASSSTSWPDWRASRAWSIRILPVHRQRPPWDGRPILVYDSTSTSSVASPNATAKTGS